MARNALHIAAFVSALSLAPLAAIAQPWDADPPPDDTTTEPTDTTAQPPAEPAPPPPQPVEPVAPPPQSDASVAAPPAPPPSNEREVRRPEGLSPGIGVGYTIPADILTPTTASVRFRFPSGITFEPIVDLSSSRSTTEVGSVETETEQNDLAIATQVRFPVAMRNYVDLVLLGSAGVAVSKQNPDGADNDTTTTALGASWGLGLDFWVKPRWVISASATNPLFSLSKTTQESPAGDTETTDLSFGATFRPAFRLMLHMFF